MKQHVALTIAAVMALFNFCVNNTGNDPDGETAAVIYEPDGATPAKSVTVKLFRPSDTTGRPVAIRITNENGRYSSDNLSDGFYNVVAGNDSLLLFQDSVMITGGRGLRDGTLSCPSSVSGRVVLQPQHDARTARIRIRGTDLSVSMGDNSGKFTIDRLAGGTYTFEVTVPDPEYQPLQKAIVVPDCSDTTLGDTVLRPVYAGIPVVEGFTATLDTLAGTINLAWNNLNYPGLIEYLIFRDWCGTIAETPQLLAATANNAFVDTTFRSLPVSVRDTIERCLHYRIAIRTLQRDTGPFHSCNEIAFVNKSVITTFFTHSVVNPDAGGDSASINDPFIVIVTAKNRTRPLKRLVWYDPTRGDSILSSATGNATGPFILQDSIRHTFPETGIRWFYAVITDVTGARWVDTIPVRIVDDVPIANAGRDAGGLPGDTIQLAGSAKQRFGTISEWFWKIGENDWTASPDGRVIVTFPLESTPLICSLAVVDEDGNRATDALRLYSNSKTKRIAARGTNSLFLSSGGTLWGCGSNTYGQLSTSTSSSVAEPVELASEVREMAICGNSTLIVKNDNTLWVCGNNASGLLANQSDISSYKQIMVMSDVKSIATGSSNCMILKTDNSLWACGSNAFGQLGTGNTATITTTPVQVMTDVRTMAVNDVLGIIVKNDNTMWACGVTSAFKALFGESDTMRMRPTPAMALTDVKEVIMGFMHLIVLKNDGSCLTCGYNGDGQIGDGTTPNNTAFFPVMDDVRSIAAGDYCSFFLKNDGTLWGCGRNSSGQLGSGNTGGRVSTPIHCMSDVQSVAAGTTHTLILKTDGTLWACGSNASGQFGDGSYAFSTIPKESFIPRY